MAKVLSISMLAFGLVTIGCRTDAQSSAGELLDNYNDMITNNGFKFPGDNNDSSTQFIIYNPLMKRYIQVKGNGVHVQLVASRTTGQPFWLTRITDGYITFTTETIPGVGNGQMTGAPLFTGDWIQDPSHQYSMQINGPSVLIKNRGNGNCISVAGSATDAAIVSQPCDASDTKQMWQICEPPSPPVNCWPEVAKLTKVKP